jgi:translation initiation factor 3 subunit E
MSIVLNLNGDFCGRVLAEKLNLNYEEAERWIVNLIRGSKLDAKIDSHLGTVIMEPNHPNV